MHHRKSVRRTVRVTVVLFFVILVVIASIASAPVSHADDRSYSIRYVSINATIDQDGTLNVTEKRILTGADERRHEKEQEGESANNDRLLVGILTAVLLGAAFAGFFRHGREYRPRFKEKYWRDVPEKGMHPAVVTRIWNNNRPDKDIPVTLMHLSNIGAIKLLDLSSPEFAPYNRKEKFAIVRVPNFNDELTEIDEAAIDFFFNDITPIVRNRGNAGKRNARNALAQIIKEEEKVSINDVLFFSDLEDAERISPSFHEDTWKIPDAINRQTEDAKPFEGKSRIYMWFHSWAGNYIMIAFALWFIAALFILPPPDEDDDIFSPIIIFALFAIGGLIPTFLDFLRNRDDWTKHISIALLLCFLPFLPTLALFNVNTHTPPSLPIVLAISGCVFMILSFFMPRRTRHATEIAAKAEALKRWLEDFSLLNERPITDVKIWGEFMVYAAAFGVADITLKKLRQGVPSVPSDPSFEIQTGIWVDSERYGSSGSSAFSSVSASLAKAHTPSSSGGGGAV